MLEIPDQDAPLRQHNSTSLARRLRCVAWRDVIELVKSTYAGWMEDKAPRLGASLAFYTLLSMAPMTIIIIAIAGLVFGQKAAEGRLVWEIQGLVGRQAALVIQSLLGSARGSGRGLVATAVGLGTLFFGATAVVNELRDALNTIWRVPPKPEQGYLQSVLSIVKVRFLSFAVVVGVGFLLMVLLVINAFLRAFGPYLEEVAPAHWIPQVVYSIASFIVMTCLFAAIFKLLPDIALEWSDVMVGSIFTAALFSIGRYLIGLYLGKSTVASAYGAAGSLVILLVWVYYSAQVFFFGAEFTAAYTRRYGSLFRRTLEVQQSQPEARVEPPRQTIPAPDVELVLPDRRTG